MRTRLVTDKTSTEILPACPEWPTAVPEQDILRLLPKRTDGSQFIFEIAYRYFKLTRAIPKAKTKAT